MLRNIKNQQRSSNLSLINEKWDLVRDPQQITFPMLIERIILQTKLQVLWIFNPETLTQICYSNPKLEDKILIQNILFINKLFRSLLLIFKSWFTFSYDVPNYETVSSATNKMFKPSYRTDFYRKNSIVIGNL